MDKITPEQAAQIVKRFILPMFDNTKKLAPKNLQQMGSVQAELMLSGQLNDQLEVVRNEVNKLTETLEAEVNTRTNLQAQLRDTQHKFLK